MIRNLLVTVAVVVLGAGCAGSGYFAKRGRDLRDVFTAELGYGVGAKARTGPLHAGLSYVWTPMGLGNGELYSFRDAATEEQCPYDVELVCMGIEGAPRGENRGKDCTAGWGWPFVAWPKAIKAGDDGKALWPHPYYTDIRVTVGCGPAVTLGFNPGELLDFMLGWFGIDVYKDDLEREKVLSK